MANDYILSQVNLTKYTIKIQGRLRLIKTTT
jgi:hypothetical protein